MAGRSPEQAMETDSTRGGGAQMSSLKQRSDLHSLPCCAITGQYWVLSTTEHFGCFGKWSDERTVSSEIP